MDSLQSGRFMFGSLHRSLDSASGYLFVGRSSFFSTQSRHSLRQKGPLLSEEWLKLSQTALRPLLSPATNHYMLSSSGIGYCSTVLNLWNAAKTLFRLP